MLLRKLKCREDGVVLVEFAIVIPILLLVVWTIIDLARAYYTVNSLATAVREGARVAAVQQDPTASSALIRARVKDAFNAFGGPPLTDDKIILYDSTTIPIASPRGKVTVEVRDYEWLTTTPINVISGGKVLMTRRAHFRWERDPT
jgi:Flp pilus assembly protein TadG